MSDKKISDLVISARHEGDAAIVAMRGEIDLHNSPELRHQMLKHLGEGGTRRLILNLAEVGYMDSSGIAVFVEALKNLRKIGGKIFLTNLQPRVKGLLEIAKLDTIFRITADEATALAEK